eukprot:TRINITY_DN1887_c0_g1_i3.p1 TRINITY_DN1887_c0_g1~~TRINITY_DN1887_c0_g1_i3.p1  ORF type:complete len:393 (+),score=81.97 TRINITY_DN1887_c0_g1_i3:91-1269(+)
MEHPEHGMNYYSHNEHHNNHEFHEGTGATGSIPEGPFEYDMTHYSPLKPVLVEDLFKMALGNNTNCSPGLSRPAFAPVIDNKKVRCAVGTEEQDPFKRVENRLIFFQIDQQEPRKKIDTMFSYSLDQHVRDIQWFDQQHALYAAGAKMGLIRLSPGGDFVEDFINFPEFHTDIIREIAISSKENRLVVSGGFDGKVFVTDIIRLAEDIQKNERRSENSLYQCTDVVGSVSWHPNDQYLANCTTDGGTFHVFDIRTDKRRAAIVSDVQKKELYSHAYLNDKNVLLGFGDGKVLVLDLRYLRTASMFQDPIQKAVGEIKFDYKTKTFFNFGIPELTMWTYEGNSFHLAGNYNLGQYKAKQPGFYKTSGELIRELSLMGVTDSNGMFALFDYTAF